MVAVRERQTAPRLIRPQTPDNVIPFFPPAPMGKDFPLSKERGKSPYLSVAAHELNHALAAFASRVGILSISVIPGNDGSLGRTILAGHPNISTFQVIAAAGAHPTTEGEAKGFGSDMTKVYIFAHYGGISADSAKGHAAGLVNSFPLDVRRKAAEIIAYKRAVSGSEFELVLRQAEWEVARDKYKKGEPFDYNPNRYAQLSTVQENYTNLPEEKDLRNVTIIDEHDTHYRIIRVALDGTPTEVLRACKICGGTNCEHLQKTTEQKSDIRRRNRIEALQQTDIK